jgi:hypothetical protein
VKTSKRSSFPVPLTGSPERLFNTRRSIMSWMMAISMMRMMRMTRSRAMTGKRTKSRTKRYDSSCL